MAFVLVHAVKFAGATSVGCGRRRRIPELAGLRCGHHASPRSHEHRSFKLWLISNGYQLVALLIMGAILAVWP